MFTSASKHKSFLISQPIFIKISPNCSVEISSMIMFSCAFSLKVMVFNNVALETASFSFWMHFEIVMSFNFEGLV